MSVEPAWVDEDWACAPAGVIVSGGRLSVPVPPGWGHSILAMPMPAMPTPKDCVPWLTCIGTVDPDPEAYVNGLRAFVEGAALGESARARSHRLLAVPVVGTGHGGGRQDKDDVMSKLIPEMYRLARSAAVDLVLVTHDSAAFAAAQLVRHAHAVEPFGELSAGLLQSAHDLGDMAARGELVLFLGAGIGQAVDLPLWRELLDELAVHARLSSDEQVELRKMSPTDQAQLLEGRMGSVAFRQKIDERMNTRRCGLGHTLLASLPIKEAVTTNYDDLFEVASEAAGRRTAVLPYSPNRTRDRWVLKLHGTIHRDDIVMTRDDYLRLPNQRRALAGMVQAMLITRHMLFVGYSLSDPDFHDTVFAVRTAVRGELDVPIEPFGSALVISVDRLQQELWKDEITFISVEDTGEQTADPGRLVEIMLDAILATATTGTPYLLDTSYEGLLSKSDLKLRTAILDLRAAAATADDSAARSIVWDFLETLGDDSRKRRS